MIQQSPSISFILRTLAINAFLMVGIGCKAQQIFVPGADPFALRDTTAITYRPAIMHESANGFSVNDAIVKTTYNSGYARGFNDGAVWKGRGLTAELHGGVSFKKNGFSLVLNPVVYYSQNREFPLTPPQNATSHPYGYQFKVGGGIDWVQRYGDQSFVDFHLGQSEIRYAIDHFYMSVSTQNFTLGPSIYNPILMSYQGGGFPHLALGATPFHIRAFDREIINLEPTLIYGLLSESDYFDNNADNDSRFLTSLSIGFIPTLLTPNLKISLSKVMYESMEYFGIEDLIAPIIILDKDFADTPGVNDSFDQTASLGIHWAFPSVGFEAYGEFAKNDFGGTFKLTLLEPEHSRAYTVGFIKDIYFKNDLNLRLGYEHTNLSRNHTYLWRAEPTYYTHSITRQGYTQNGQLMGAGIGPGANSDQLDVSAMFKNQKFKFTLQRVEYNKDYHVIQNQSIDDHNSEYTGGFFYQRTSGDYTYTAGAEISHSMNFNFDDPLNNLALSFGVRRAFTR